MNDVSSTPNARRLSIVDAHVHFYDNKANTHAFLDARDDTYEALVGDYSALPRRYLPGDYLADTTSCDVQGVIWHEYLSDDAVKETRWAQHLAETSGLPQAMVALVDFLDPALEQRLETYRALPNVSAVREHLGWDTSNPKKRFAKRSDLLTDSRWRQGVAALLRHDFKCGLEIFSPQASDLLDVVRLYPDIGFTLAVMAWPLDISPDGFAKWKHDVGELGRCANVSADISAIECIFGLNWTTEQIAPWILSLIDAFGPDRIMFGSHLPIAKLSFGFDRLYGAYQHIVRDFSEDEKDLMFRRVAAEWFRIR